MRTRMVEENPAMANALISAGIAPRSLKLSADNQARTERIKRSFGFKTVIPDQPLAVLDLPQSKTQAPPEPTPSELETTLNALSESHSETVIESTPDSPQAEPQIEPQAETPTEILAQAPAEPQPQPVNLPPVVAAALKQAAAPYQDLKTSHHFALDQIRVRKEAKELALKRAQEEFDFEVAAMEKIRLELHQIDEFLDTIRFTEQIASQCPTPTGSRYHFSNSGEKKPITRPSPNDPTVFRSSELREFFQTHQGVAWSAKAVLDEIPLCKQAHAKTYLPTAMNILCKEGFINRVEKGRYMMPVPQAKAPVQKAAAVRVVRPNKVA